MIDTIKTMLGVFLVSLPFIVITALMVKKHGWEMAAIVWAFAIVLIATMFIGLALLEGRI